MMFQSVGGVDPVFLAYVACFAVTSLACLASVRRARQIEDPDTRRGMVALLLTSGAWAATTVGYLVAPSPQVKVGFYVVGLVVGLAAVGPWLYFCSAYSGRSLHRNATYRRVLVLVFLALVLVKVTNPLHQLYFTTETVASPSPHLAIQHQTLHWMAMGAAYALAAVGYFMLLELFSGVGYDTRPFAALVGLTALPVVFNVVGHTTTVLVDIPYEPLGVAVFALGVLFVYLDQFQAIRLAGSRDEPVIVLSSDGRIREFNDRARALFPHLVGGDPLGENLETALPDVAAVLDSETGLLETELDGVTRYYRVSSNQFAAAGSALGQFVTLTDVTHREQYRRELERQNERLDQFATVVSHDLRNPIEVANAGVELARDDCDSPALDEVETALDRMTAIVDDVLDLARQGQPIDDTSEVSVASVAEQCWGVVPAGDAELVVDGDRTLQADGDRFQQLLENLFRNAIEHGGDGVTVRVGALPDGLYVEDDGPGIPEEIRDDVFEAGFSSNPDGTGFGLAIVAEIVDAHGWRIRATESDAGGARFEVTGVVDD